MKLEKEIGWKKRDRHKLKKTYVFFFLLLFKFIYEITDRKDIEEPADGADFKRLLF